MSHGPHLPDDVTGRDVPGLAPFIAASKLAVPLRDALRPEDEPLRLLVLGRAKPVSGRPLPVIGRTDWLGPCAQGEAAMATNAFVCQKYSSLWLVMDLKPDASVKTPK